MMNKDEVSDLQFPLECHFRVIAHDQEGIAFVIETVLMELGITSPVEPANTSSGGKYVSFNITVLVESLEQMNLIERSFASAESLRAERRSCAREQNSTSNVGDTSISSEDWQRASHCHPALRAHLASIGARRHAARRR